MSDQHHPPADRTLVVGLSGPSSSGKTTLAGLLRSIFNVPPSSETQERSIKLFIFHQDDTYKTDTEIPYVTTRSGHQLQDWDCAEALDLALLESTLRHVRNHGALPPELHSKEDEKSVGVSGVSDAVVQTHQAAVVSWLSQVHDLPEAVRSITICILEGFLLYSHPARRPIPRRITDLLDVKLFIRSDCARTKTRREARKGYVTLEGFWEDPEGYVEEVVWPNYVSEHNWMFADGDVDKGEVEEERVREEGILVGPGKGEKSMEELLAWCIETMEKEIGRILGDSRR